MLNNTQRAWVRVLGLLLPVSVPFALGAGNAKVRDFAKLPLSFERRGESEFVARGQGYSMKIRGRSATLTLPASHASKTLRMEFIDARAVPALPEGELPGKVNYILGNDRRQWRLNLPTFARVTYRGLYPGIDISYYGNQRQIEFDLVLQPRADARSIRMRFEGAGEIHTDSLGALVLGDLRLMPPIVIQGKKKIRSQYRLTGKAEVAFELGLYDRAQPLVIDPTLVYATRLGGGNNSNQGSAISVDSTGNAYVAGYTFAADFPVFNAAFPGAPSGGDGFVSKIDPTGTTLIYSTYIGGSNADFLAGIAVDSTGSAWVTGYTYSFDFPLLNSFQSTLQGSSDAVVVKLSPSGSLAYSTFLGGPGQELGYSIAVDPVGNAYAAGYASTGFPTTAGVYQPAVQGGLDAFVTKFNTSGALVWSTAVGGASADYATGVAVDSFGNSYITGTTFSTSLAGVPPGAAQPVNHGNGDAFVAKLNFNGSALLYFTFLGGSGADAANAIAVNPTTGLAYVAGYTTSTDLVTSAGALQPTNAGGYDGFAANVNAAGSAFSYLTYLGGNRRDFLQAIAVDPQGNAYVSGYSNSNTLPTSAAIQSAIQGNSTSLFHTSDAGVNWASFDTHLSGAALGISPDPANPGTVVASSDNGTFRTTDNGATWQQQTSVGYMTLARSPANPATIYGSTGSPIYQSIDNGVTWLFRGSIAVCCAAGIIADPSSAATAYVFYSFNSSVAPVQKTTDNGMTWNPAVTGFPANALVTAMAAGSDGSLYAGLAFAPGGSPGGVYKSSNHGASWAAINTGLPSIGIPPLGLTVSPSNPSIIYASDYFFLYGSPNGGSNWTPIGPLPGGTVSLTVSSSNSSTLFYAAYDSAAPLWGSTNGGLAWSPSAGAGAANAGRIVADPQNAGGAYALASVSSVPVVAKIDAAGQNLLYSTYLGDQGAAYGIATNGAGEVLVAGSTTELPTTPSAIQRNRNYYYNNQDGFVARISDATAGCTYSIDPQQSLEVWFPHVVHYVVTAPTGCAWTASSNQPWATIVSGASGSGSGIVYVVANNTASTTQTATLTIAGQSILLRQRTVNGCGYNTFSPEASVVPGAGGNVQFNMVVAAGCQWTVTAKDPTAVTVTSSASGTGPALVTLSVAPNLGPVTRTLTVYSQQGDQETISQAGTTAPAVVSAITSSPSGASITVSGNGCIAGTYTTPANLTWNANTNCTVFFTTPQFIGGTQYVFNSATVNGGPASNSNPVTVNSGTNSLTINASYTAPCMYSLSPAGQGFGAQGGVSSFTVNTGPSCSWSPAPSANWITILPSGSKGTGKVNYAIAANGGGSRTGTITVAGQNYNIDQQAFSCSYSINPSATSFGNTGGAANVVVTAPAGCSWNATSNAPWMTLSTGSGTGSRSVVVTASANPGGARSGTVTIAGQTFSATQSATTAPTFCGAADVSQQVHVTQGAFKLASIGFGSALYTETVSVTNTSAGAIPGPIYLALIGLPTHHHSNIPDSGFVTAPSGTIFTACFTPEGDYLVPIAGGLQPGQSTPTVTYTFVDAGWGLNYSAKVVSGTPSK